MIKLLLTILISFAFFTCFSQTKQNNGVSKKIIVDTFYQKRAEFLSYSWNDLNVIDTVKNVKDTLVINFQNNEGFIREEIKIKNDRGCVKESLTKYINSKKLVIYSEHWSFTCQKTNPNDYDGVLDTYHRYVYDSMHILITEFVKNIRIDTWRYDYLYDKEGGQYTKATKITRNEFWAE